MLRPTVAEIDLDAFQDNIRAVRRLLNPGVGLMAVIKADAYGHGALPCAQAAVQAGVETLGVGIISEGIELRESGIQAPIQVLGGIFPEEIDDLIHHRLTTTLWDAGIAEGLAKRAQAQQVQMGVHLKVDTGMGRLGVSPDQLPALVEQIRKLKALRIESVFTHFATADEPDPEYTHLQLQRFTEALRQLAQAGIHPPCVHAANSAALLQFPESQFSMVRPGILLYGALTSPHLIPARDRLNQMPGPVLRPVMAWKSRIIQLSQIPKESGLSYGKTYKTQKKSWIATLPVGYADGLQRRLSGKLDVLVRGRRAPQVGAICMDMCLVDVTAIPEVRQGDPVVLFGEQNGTRISIEEMADRCDTIPYEIMCCVGKRVPRVYLP